MNSRIMKHPTVPSWQLPYEDETVAFPMEVVIRKCFHNGKLIHAQVPKHPRQVRQIVLGDSQYDTYNGSTYSYLKSKLEFSIGEEISCWRNTEDEKRCEGHAVLQSVWVSVPLVLIFEFEGSDKHKWSYPRFMALRGRNENDTKDDFNYELVSRAYHERISGASAHFTCNVITSTGLVHHYNDTTSSGVMSKEGITPNQLARTRETYSYRKTVAVVYRLQGGRQSQKKIERALHGLLEPENIRITPGAGVIPEVSFNSVDPELIPDSKLSNYTLTEYVKSADDSGDNPDVNVKPPKGDDDSMSLPEIVTIGPAGVDFMSIPDIATVEGAGTSSEGDDGVRTSEKASSQQISSTNRDVGNTPLAKLDNPKKRPSPPSPRGPVTRSKTRRLEMETWRVAADENNSKTGYSVIL